MTPPVDKMRARPTPASDDARLGDMPRYGEFPHLFWDLAPDAPVDLENDVVLARLLIDGRAEDLVRTGALRVACTRLSSLEQPPLELPPHIRRFWTKMFAETVAGLGG